MALSAVASWAPTGGGALVCADAPPATAASMRMTTAKAEPAARRVFNGLTTLISSRRLTASTFPLRKSEVAVPWLVRRRKRADGHEGRRRGKEQRKNFLP